MNLQTKIRKVIKVSHKDAKGIIKLNDILKMLHHLTHSEIVLFDENGVVIAKVFEDSNENIIANIQKENKCAMTKQWNDIFQTADESQLFKNNKDLLNYGENSESYSILVTPIIASNIKQALLVMSKQECFSCEDTMLAEIISVFSAHYLSEKKCEDEKEREIKVSDVKVAISTLSFSELEALINVFSELSGTEGFLVTSKIADKIGITRSVVVNALRKFESAGVIETRSLGMKGTYIKVINDLLLPELKNLRK